MFLDKYMWFIIYVCVTKFWIRAKATQGLQRHKEYSVSASNVYDTISHLNPKFPSQQCNSMLAD